MELEWGVVGREWACGLWAPVKLKNKKGWEQDSIIVAAILDRVPQAEMQIINPLLIYHRNPQPSNSSYGIQPNPPYLPFSFLPSYPVGVLLVLLNITQSMSVRRCQKQLETDCWSILINNTYSIQFSRQRFFPASATQVYEAGMLGIKLRTFCMVLSFPEAQRWQLLGAE